MIAGLQAVAGVVSLTPRANALVWPAEERSILIAVREGDIAPSTLQQAVEMARALRARLHIIHVRTLGKRARSRGSARLLVDSLRAAQGALAVAGTDSSWPPQSAEKLVSSAAVLQGDFVQRVAAYAEAVSSMMIVMAGTGVDPGRCAAALALTAQRPVLLPAVGGNGSTAADSAVLVVPRGR